MLGVPDLSSCLENFDLEDPQESLEHDIFCIIIQNTSGIHDLYFMIFMYIIRFEYSRLEYQMRKNIYNDFDKKYKLEINELWEDSMSLEKFISILDPESFGLLTPEIPILNTPSKVTFGEVSIIGTGAIPVGKIITQNMYNQNLKYRRWILNFLDKDTTAYLRWDRISTLEILNFFCSNIEYNKKD